MKLAGMFMLCLEPSSFSLLIEGVSDSVEIEDSRSARI